MSEILDNLQRIKTEKTNKVIPGNIKAGVTMFGVEGALVGEEGLNNQDISIDRNGTFRADEGYTGLGEVTVNVETLNTADATATPKFIFKGKTAYVNGEKITGTLNGIIEDILDVSDADTITVEGSTLVIGGDE